MTMVLAFASILFSTSSAMALRGLLCDSAMMRIAFQSSPIRNLPRSDALDFTALILPLPEINHPLYRKESFFPRFNRRQSTRNLATDANLWIAGGIRKGQFRRNQYRPTLRTATVPRP